MAAPPAGWAPMAGGSEFALVDVAAGCAEYVGVQQNLRATMGAGARPKAAPWSCADARPLTTLLIQNRVTFYFK